jgi:hypothetical protein
MRFSIIPLLILSAAPLSLANQALDVLEGKIDANSIVLPSREGVDPAAESIEEIIYLEPAWAASPLDTLWSRSVLYSNGANPWIQEFALSGHYDARASFGKAETEEVAPAAAHNTDLDNSRTRRARLGARFRAFRNTEIEAVGEFAGDENYRGLERLKARTQLSDTVAVTAGKFLPNLGTESRTEPQLSPYFNSGVFHSMVAPAPALGVSLSKEIKNLSYDFGWFASQQDPKIGSLSGDGMLNFSISRTFTEQREKLVSRTRFHADYIHNFDVNRSNSTGYQVAGRNSANGNQLIVQNPAYRHLFALGLRADTEKSSFTGDFHLGKGDSTAWALSFGSSRWLFPGLVNLVGRYQYASSKDERGILAAPGISGDLRYDSTPFFTGDTYHSFYLGTNLHLYKDSLVLRNGMEYMIFNDDAGAGFNTESLSWQSGASLSF